MVRSYRTDGRHSVNRRTIFALGTAAIVPGPFGRQVDPEGSTCPDDPCVPPLSAPAAAAPPLEVGATIEPGPNAVGITFVVTATNRTDAPLSLTFRTGQYCDVMVTAADGTFIWRWAAGRMFTQAIREVSLDPGQAREVRIDWREAPTMLAARDAPWIAWVNWVSDPGGSAGPISFGPDLPAPPSA